MWMIALMNIGYMLTQHQVLRFLQAQFELSGYIYCKSIFQRNVESKQAARIFLTNGNVDNFATER